MAGKWRICLMEWMPMKNENVLMLRHETNSLVFSNAMGIPLIAFSRDSWTRAYFVLGVKEPMFWFIITCIASMLPVVGCSIGLCACGDFVFCEWHEH